jgi:hypothetical protein
VRAPARRGGGGGGVGGCHGGAGVEEAVEVGEEPAPRASGGGEAGEGERQNARVCGSFIPMRRDYSH